ncbi:hypothetical protein [Floridanema evergladense]|uniref:Uncharacterized protein n=1 Tax=Floridaenema evergladense BLCC-F167 TaxID=3153639 RepID=A0ABV4WYE1_9CYAN
MSLNRLIAGVAIAGLTVLTAASTVPSFAAEKVSSQAQTQQYAQRYDRDWDRDRDDRWRDRRVCYYERRGRRVFYCCRERYWNGRYYQVRISCRPDRR